MSNAVDRDKLIKRMKIAANQYVPDQYHSIACKAVHCVLGELLEAIISGSLDYKKHTNSNGGGK